MLSKCVIARDTGTHHRDAWWAAHIVDRCLRTGRDLNPLSQTAEKLADICFSTTNYHILLGFALYLAVFLVRGNEELLIVHRI